MFFFDNPHILIPPVSYNLIQSKIKYFFLKFYKVSCGSVKCIFQFYLYILD